MRHLASGATHAVDAMDACARDGRTRSAHPAALLVLRAYAHESPRENTILTIFMSVVWTSWKLPIFIKFHQKFHTPEDLIRGPRSNLDPTSDLDPTSHLDPTSTPTSTPSLYADSFGPDGLNEYR